MALLVRLFTIFIALCQLGPANAFKLGYGASSFLYPMERQHMGWHNSERRNIRAVAGAESQKADKLSTSSSSEPKNEELSPIFGDWSSQDDQAEVERRRAALLRKLTPEGEEPLVYSRYDRDCFFTPVNCYMGKARLYASNIVGAAFNSKRHILFVRRPKKNQRRKNRFL